MIKKFLTILFIAGFMMFQSAQAADDSLIFNGYVSDGAYLFSDVVIENLNKTVQDLYNKTGSEIDVVTLKSLNGKDFQVYLDDIEKIRSKKVFNIKNRAVLFYAMKEDYLQLYLDEWFEDKVDTTALQNIGERDILPYFATGELDKGMVRGVYLIADEIAKVDKQKVEHFGIMPPAKKLNALLWLWLLLIPILGGLGGAIWFIIAGKKQKTEEQDA